MMSSPIRQMNQRRLPPLPGVQQGKSGRGGRPTTEEMIITGRHKKRKIKDVSPELVTHFLNENPEFLDRYVTTHVSEDKIRQWSLRKGSKNVHTRQHNLNGDLLREKKSSKWKTCVQSSKWKVLHEMTRDISYQTDRLQILAELAQCAVDSTSADGFNLYLADSNQQLYHHKVPPISSSRGSRTTDRPSVLYIMFLSYRGSRTTDRPSEGSYIGNIETGTSLPSYVAKTKDTIRTNHVQGDMRFPAGLGIKMEHVQTVLAIPILQEDSGVLGVIELYRQFSTDSFTQEDEEVTATLLVWADVCVEYVQIAANMIFWGSFAVYFIEMYNSMMRQRKLNDFLLAVTKSIFQDIVSMDTVIMKIMNYAKKLVNADRASLFLLDTKTTELYARIFDTGKEHVPQKEIRFPMDKGVAGHVASTGQVLNITDAYNDGRFNREVDMQTGYRTKSILCMPIYIRGSIIGVVQMVNKKEGTFTMADEESFETFAIYCGLALHHAKLYDKIRRSEQKYKVALEVLSYHAQCTDDEYKIIKSTPFPDNIPGIIDYEFSPWDVEDNRKCLYVLYMMKDIFSMATKKNENEKRYDLDDMIRFTMTVKKNYRNVPYHNWAHAFSVAHAVYTVIKTTKHSFSPVECLALYVACLCHDLDHRGKTNAFMVKSASPLAAIYSTSTMEHHHFNHTVTILQNEGHNIFKHLTSDQYKQILGDIRQCILATDLALFFGNRARLQEVSDKNEFSWDDSEHRHVLMAISMTACDLCSMYKPWDVQLQVVNVIMEEFWLQGDEEKSQGLTPMPMMDRDKKDELPHLEVGFLVGICLPCYELMAQVLPNTKPMVDGAVSNLKKWKYLAENKLTVDQLPPEQCVKQLEYKTSENIQDSSETNKQTEKDDSDEQNKLDANAENKDEQTEESKMESVEENKNKSIDNPSEKGSLLTDVRSESSVLVHSDNDNNLTERDDT
ncbi:probable 3',5'-cyclic phosphodiesterase pde-5 isoform X9 [Mytilus edulis]|uniref:probable 3',5'-cyclic phosphodiesterase pde-5 isoform X9 n=1 Tax=Mytilus edulis TaxID=6550 RepID=UPI0039EF73D9